MESINYHEESINSSEEDQENNDLGVGRSYECVFCKRGFNTAQALGGHMNIHRKDRARNKPNPNKLQHHHQQIYTTTPRLYHNQDHQPIFTYATYFPASTSTSTRPTFYDNYHHQSDHSDRDQDQAPVDWRMSLSLEFPPRIMEDHVEKNRDGINQEKDLDLELRLGYDS